MRGSARHQLCKCLRTSQASSLHQGDVLEEEVQEEEWSDAGRHPPRHFPAADLTRPNHIHAEISHTCLHLILFH